jgi:hypothetical protein
MYMQHRSAEQIGSTLRVTGAQRLEERRMWKKALGEGCKVLGGCSILAYLLPVASYPAMLQRGKFSLSELPNPLIFFIT